MRRNVVLVLGLLVGSASGVAAQMGGKAGSGDGGMAAKSTMSGQMGGGQMGAGQTPREVQLAALANQRKTLLAMADSMPEKFYRAKATPVQRDFAQQIHHAGSVAAYIATSVLKGPAVTLPDTAATFGSRAGLKRYINASFDYLDGVAKAQTPAARGQTVSLFGQSMPAWQVWDEIQTHTVWTAGQVVANFRMNGMAPPAFSFF